MLPITLSYLHQLGYYRTCWVIGKLIYLKRGGFVAWTAPEVILTCFAAKSFCRIKVLNDFTEKFQEDWEKNSTKIEPKNEPEQFSRFAQKNWIKSFLKDWARKILEIKGEICLRIEEKSILMDKIKLNSQGLDGIKFPRINLN